MPGTTAPQRPRTSRKPTGLPNPPLILLCGPEKCGKSYEAALGTGSDLIGMTYWLEIGGSEGTADYYGKVPGARYEIVEHNGAYQDILDAIRWIIAQPRIDGKPNMIVVDNGTNLWDMISDEQALFARRRAVRKAQEQKRRGPSLDDPVVVDSDLWNRAKDRWGEFLWLLRRHAGPVVLIARQEIVTAFENDKPTRNTTRKIKAEKNLPAAADAIVELRGLGDAYLTGVRTLHWEVKPGETERYRDFSIDNLLRRLGFHEAADTRQVTESRPDAYLDEEGPQDQDRQNQQRPQSNQTPALTGPELVGLVHKALNNTDPESCLRDIRELWGVNTLKHIRTRTNAWGEMDGDALITKALHAVQERAGKKEQDANAGQGNQPTGPGQEPTSGPAPQDGPQEQAREHQDQDQDQVEPESSAEHDAVPPPPDPQAEEPPPGESPEETSQAEEPQDAPAPARPAARKNRGEELALKTLRAEANVQARLKMVTLGEYLEPIAEGGDPGLPALRRYVLNHRPDAIKYLEAVGQTELAEYYRNAPPIAPQLAKRFESFFESAPAGQ